MTSNLSQNSRSQSRPIPPNLSSTSLRPRGKRLISGLDDPIPNLPPQISASNNSLPSSASTPIESPFHSRAVSPIPSKHPSRSSSTQPSGRLNGLGFASSAQAEQLGSDLANSFSGLWGKSWTSLQGLASNVLGSDASQELVKDKSPRRQRRPLEATHAHSQWGPRPREESQPGAGSKEERRAMLRAQKRQQLLMTTDSLTPDSARYKRRTSDDFESASAPPGEHDDRDALIYIHHVKPEDTLAGISIKFNCQLPPLKRANRLWSDFAVQTRKTLMVPVDACGVKGRPTSSPKAEEDLVSGDASSDNAPTPTPTRAKFPDIARTNSSSTIRASARVQTRGEKPEAAASNNYSPSLTSSRGPAEEPAWRHDSWVQLDNHAAPVELARIPRSSLGFFPRARRKSVSYSDLDTPSESFDLPRPSITVSDTSSQAGERWHRKRGSSGSQVWAQQIMNKPGGVGKLHGKGPSAPGPAAGLDQVLGKRLPTLLSPTQTTYEEGEHDPASSPVRSLENFGGAIEGWVRKVAKNAAKAIEPPPSSMQTRRNLGMRQGSEDIIELSNAFEIGDDDLDEENYIDEQARGRTRTERSPTRGDFYDGASKRKGD